MNVNNGEVMSVVKSTPTPDNDNLKLYNTLNSMKNKSSICFTQPHA